MPRAFSFSTQPCSLDLILLVQTHQAPHSFVRAPKSSQRTWVPYQTIRPTDRPTPPTLLPTTTTILEKSTTMSTTEEGLKLAAAYREAAVRISILRLSLLLNKISWHSKRTHRIRPGWHSCDPFSLSLSLSTHRHPHTGSRYHPNHE